MHPELFSIGPFTLHTYGLLVAIAFTAALIVTVRLGKSQGFSSQQVLDMGFIIILAALIGSRLMYVLINAPHFLQRPIDIFRIWQGGLVFSGGIIGVFIAAAWYSKKHGLSLWALGDLWAPAAALGQGIGRIGCLMAGCCYGKPTDVKWAIVFTDPHSLAPKHIPLHPTQIYSSISGLVIFFVLFILHSRKKFEGQVLLWFLILHSTARLFIERFRGDDRGMILGGSVTVTQLVSLLILIVSAVSIIIIRSKIDKRKSGSK